MLFIIYRMFFIRKIAKNGFTCSKNNERLAVTFRNCHKKFHYYWMFAIRNFVLFALRYSVFVITWNLLCVIFGIACSNYMNNE